MFYPRELDTEDEMVREILKWCKNEGFTHKLVNLVARNTEDPLILPYISLIGQDLCSVIKQISTNKINNSSQYKLYCRMFMS